MEKAFERNLVSSGYCCFLLDDHYADLHCEVLKHLAYTPDLAPSDYCLFPDLNKYLK
jgi:hypothetical protein